MAHTVSESYATRRELRQFGGGLGLFCILAGGGLLWKGSYFGVLLWMAGGGAFLACWFDWPGVRPFYAGWMRAAGVMARVMTVVLLAVTYLSVVTPTGLLGRLCGQRFIERRFREPLQSYWMPRTVQPAVEDCERQS